MAMGRRRAEQQEAWVATTDLPRSPGHPFYQKLNDLLDEHGFDKWIEDLCRPFYADRLGRPSIPPGIFFRMILVGYFEGIGTQRGIAWRCSDSRSLADFLGYAVNGRLGEGEVGRFLMGLANAKKPIVAGVDGLAIGVGVTMQFHCDMTFATARCDFRTPFVDLALVPEAGSTLLGPRVMGYQRAFAMLAAGVGLSGDDARDAGLVYKVVSEDQLEISTLAAAETIASKPPEAMQIARELMRGGTRDEVVGRIREESSKFSERLGSAEARAAFEAFLAKSRKAG